MKLILFLPLVCSALALSTSGCERSGAPGSRPAGGAPGRSHFILMDVSRSPLSDFMDEDLGSLKRYLATSAHWKLTREGETLLAVRREAMDESTPDAGKLRMTADGFYFKHQPWRRYRMRLGIGAPPVPPDQEWERIRSQAVAGGRDVQLEVQPVEHPDHRSYLLLSGENQLYLEILEESMDQSRERTRRLLQETSEEFEKLLELDEEEEGRPQLEGLLPPKSISTAPAVLKLERVPRASGLHVFGYINPQAEGFIYLRLFNAAGEEIEPGMVRAQTTEYVGWSPDEKKRFFFNSRLQLPETTPAPARAELWFQPEAGGEPRKLLETRV